MKVIDLLPNGIKEMFDRMEIAEEEIGKALERHPAKVEEINNAFRSLAPSSMLTGKNIELYRAHCRELLDRVAKGQDIRFGTKAEVIVALSNASLNSPLQSRAAALYERLFHEVFGDKLGPRTLSEPWEGAGDEILAELQRKLKRERGN